MCHVAPSVCPFLLPVCLSFFVSCSCSNLFNKAELALLLVGCPPQMNEAQLLLHLYAAKGLDMLGMLQGQYAFCLYDSKQVRHMIDPVSQSCAADGALGCCCMPIILCCTEDGADVVLSPLRDPRHPTHPQSCC